MAAETKNQYMKPKRRSSISAPLMFVVIIFSAIFVMSVSFRVSNIQVNGNEHYTDEEIINAIDIEQGDNLFFFDRFAAVSRVFAKLPYVEEVSITRNLPNVVIIDVSESKAIAYIKMGSELWTMDHKCKLLGKATEDEESELISIIGFDPGTFYIGETLTQSNGETDAVEYLIELLTEFQDRGITSKVSEIDMTDINNVFFRYDDRYKVIIGNSDITERKISLALSAISQLKSGDIGIITVLDGTACTFSPY